MKLWPVQDAKARFSEMLETRHDMTVVTRNVRDFEALAARVINPLVFGAET